MSDNFIGDLGDLLYSGISSGADLVRDFLPSQVDLGNAAGYFAEELPSWMHEPAQQMTQAGFGMDALGELINARSVGGTGTELPWYTQANNFLRDNKDLIGFGVGGGGALISYLDAKKRNKLAADALKKQLERKAALDAERKALGTPMDYSLARTKIAAPSSGGNEAMFFSNNALSANPGVLRAAGGGGTGALQQQARQRFQRQAQEGGTEEAMARRRAVEQLMLQKAEQCRQGVDTQPTQGEQRLLQQVPNLGRQFAKGGKYIDGATPGQDDSVPALLSDGEFVLSADVVSALGDGNNDAGAARLEELMRNVRQHRNKGGGALPPKAKSPLAYMKKGKK